MSDIAQTTGKGFPSIVSGFGYSPVAPAIWRADSRTGLQCRDLSLDKASSAALTSHHYRTGGAQVETAALGAASCAFAFLYVLAGKVSMTSPDGTARTLMPMDCACRYGSGPAMKWTLSHDAEVIEIAATASGAEALGTPSRGDWHISTEAESAYTLGDGPRKFFKYRDLGVAAATGRRVHIHIVRSTQAVDGGTGWHSHSMGQLFYVLRGWADLAVDGRPWVRMGAGDAMCVAPRMAHNVPAFSADYLVLEMCIPADYDTVDTTVDL